MSDKAKAVYTMIALTIAVAISVFFSISDNNSAKDNAFTVNDSDTVSEKAGTAPSSGNDIGVDLGEKYCLVIEGGTLCAYRIGNGGKTLVASAPVSPLLTTDETEKLRKGIYADTFEDLCLSFEAYAS